MTTILDLIGGVQNAIAGLASVVGLIFAALWGRERGKRKEADKKAETHETMREHEHDAGIQTDTSLADRLTRR